MIALFTDFGLEGPYTGQMKAVLHRMAPGVKVIDLFADAPMGDPKTSAYLLAAYAPWFPEGTVFLCVVDPGVGGERAAVVVEADGRVFVGPGGGPLRACPAPRGHDANRRDRLASGTPVGQLSRTRPLCARGRDDRPRRASARPPDRRPRLDAARLARRPRGHRLRRPFRQRHDGAQGVCLAAGRSDSPLPAAFSIGRGPSPTGRRARPSGTRIPMALPRSRSISAAPTATSASPSERRSRSSSARARCTSVEAWSLLPA